MGPRRCSAVALAGTTAALTVLLAAPASAQDAATPTVGIAQNRAPVVADDRLVVVQGGRASLDVFANDSDPDGDGLSVMGGTSAGHGTVSFAGGVVTFAADADFTGDDSFLYLAGDGRGGMSTGTVHITVIGQAAPAATPWNGRPAAPPAGPPQLEVARQVVPQAVRPVAARTAVSRPQRATTGTVAARRVPVAGPMGPSTTPYVAPVAARPATLPFTGANETLLPLGLGLLLTGALAMAAGRRRTS